MVYFDDILKDIGQFGRYQKKMLFLIGLVSIHAPTQLFLPVFIGGDMHFQCTSTTMNRDGMNRSMRMRANNSVSIDSIGDTDRFGMNYSVDGNVWDDVCNISSEMGDGLESACPDIEFDTSVFESTIRSQWKLVCDRDYMVALVQTFFMAGCLLGTSPVGYLADRYGRKRVMLICILIDCVVNSVAAYLPNYHSFVCFRFISGMLTGSIIACHYVYILEMIGPDVRSYITVYLEVFFTVGIMFVTGASYVIRNHRHLQITLGLLPLLYIAYHWIVPESPRWLLSVNRHEEARVIIKKMARVNRTELSDHSALISADEVVKAGSVFDLFKLPFLRRVTVISCFNWFVTSLVYYGILLSGSSLGGNVFLNMILNAIAIIPSLVIATLVINRIGRTKFLATTYTISALCCIGASVIVGGTHLHWLLLCLTMVAVSAIANSFLMLYLYSAEVFPTVARTSGVGLCSTFARIGGLAASQVSRLGYIWSGLPFLVFALLSLTSGLLAFLLPETIGKKIPETADEGEALAKNYRKICCVEDRGIRGRERIQVREDVDTSEEKSPIV